MTTAPSQLGFEYVWPGLVPLAALTALAIARPGARLYSALFAAVVFLLVQWFLPRCRFRTQHYLSPINLALGLFLLKLAVVPILLMVDRPTLGSLTELPSHASMEGALLVEVVAFVGFSLALQFVPDRMNTSGVGPWLLAALNRVPPFSLGVLYAAGGAVGLLAAFKTVGVLIEYFNNPGMTDQLRLSAEGLWPGLFGTVLRPFLAFALIILWCRHVDGPHRKGAGMSTVLITLVVGFGVMLSNMTFSFNRAAFVFPLVSLSAVFLARVRRIAPLWIVASAALVLPPLAALSVYRTGSQHASEFIREGGESRAKSGSLSSQIQLYASGPQFLGFFLDYVGWGRELCYGRTLAASAMSPVPMLGKGFRESSGVAFYNRAIYGESGIEDQILPLQGELFYNFHILGVAAGYFLLGILLGKAQLWFESSQSAMAAFALHYVSLWAAMMIIWSLAIFSQIVIYFFAPVYVLIAYGRLTMWSERQARRAPGYSVAVERLGAEQ